MSEQVPEERFVLRVEEQVEGVARFLDALGIVPEALRELSAQINATPIGDLSVFHGKGAQLAQAVAAGYQASIRGALAGGLTPADFALQAVGGDDLRRALASQADAAAQYARALQAVNEATARARQLGLPALGGGPVGALPAATPTFAARAQEDQARTARHQERLSNVLQRLEARIGAEPRVSFDPATGAAVVGTERLAQPVPVDLPDAREERALRRQAEQAAIDANRAILDSMQRRATAERTVSPSNVPIAADIEDALGARNASLFLRGRALAGGTAARLTPEQRLALFGSEEIIPGRGRLTGPGFTNPEAEFQRLLAARAGAGARDLPELETGAVQAAREARRQERERETAERVARERAIAAERAEEARRNEEAENERRRRRNDERRRAREAEELVTVYRGSNEPIDLRRITAEGIRVTQQRDYAEAPPGVGETAYLYRGQIPRRMFGDASPFTGEALPHTRLSAEQFLAANFELIRQPPRLTRGADEPPPLARKPLSAEDQIARLTAAGVPEDQARQMAGAARQLAPATGDATTAVRGLARAVDELGDQARQSSAEVRGPFRAGPGGVIAPGGDRLPVPTGETLAETRLRLARSAQALEGVFPRADIDAERAARARADDAAAALRARLLGAGSPLALTAGGAGGLGGVPPGLIPFAGSFGGGGFGGPAGPFGGARSGPGGPGAFGFGSVPFDFDDLDDRARERAQSRRRAREAFNDTDPDFESQVNEEARRRQESQERERVRQTRAQQQRVRAERLAHEEDRARRLGDEPFFRMIFDSFSGPNGESFGRQFKAGLVGGRFGQQADLGMQLGQTAKFSLLYGGAYTALFQVSQALTAITAEALAFEDALVALEVATQRSRGDVEGLAQSTGEIAARAGLAPSAGVQIAAQSIGLFGAVNASPAVQQQTAEISARVAAQVARVTGATPDQTITQLAGVSRSLGLGVNSLPDIQDALTFVGRRTGRNIADLLPALSNVGTLGVGAGFNAEELAAIIGQVTSTTGQTPLTAAGSFRQVLSRADDPTFQNKVSQLFGFDATGMSLRDIFANVAATDPNRQQINEFSLLFGRGASQQVAQIVTRDFDRINELATGARGAAGSGIGEDEFNKVMATIGNQVRLLGTNFLELGKDLAETGIFDALAGLVVVLNQTVQAVDYVVDAFNQIPRPLRTVAFVLAELYAVSRLMAAAGVTSRVGGAVIGAVDLAASSSAAAGTRGLTRTAVVGSGVLGNVLGVGTTRGALLRAGAGGLLAAALNDMLNQGVQVGDSLQGAESLFGSARSSADLRETAAAARQARRAAEERSLFGLGNLLTGSGDRAAAAGNLAAAARQQANELDRLDRQTRRRGSAEAQFGGFDSADAVGTALQGLAERGFTAEQRIRGLNTAFDALISKSTQSADTVATIFAGQGGQFGAAIGRASTRALVGDNGVTGLLRNLADASAPASGLLGAAGSAFVTPLDFLDNLTGSVNPFSESGREKQIKFDEAADKIDQANLKRLAKVSGDAALEALRGRGKDPAQGNVALDQGDVAAINEATLAAAKDVLGPSLKGLDKSVRQQILRAYAGSIAGEIRGTLGDFSGENINPTNTAAFLAGSVQEAAAAGQEKGLITGDPLLGAGRNLGALREARAKVVDALRSELSSDQRKEIYQQLRSFDLQILQAEEAFTTQRIARAEALAEVEKSRLGLDDTLGRRAIDLETIRGQLEKTRDPNARSQLRAQINELTQQQEQDRIAAEGANDLAAIDPRAVVARTRAQLENARARLGTLTPGSEAFGQTQDQIAQLEQSLREQRIERINSQVRLSVAGQDSGLARARANVEIARNSLRGQLRGTQAYNDALAALRQEQRALALAELAFANTRDQLRGDLSDPVEAARDQVRAARRRLRADRRSGQGEDVLAQDRVDLQNARLQREAAAFQQRFGDAQVAEQLGQISHAQYLNYLQGERTRLADRLAGMKKTDDGYRQAVEQLQQIDLAIKGASDQVDGMFNLGDIKVPTPFEVRRFIAGAATGVGAPGQAIVNNNIQIDGADVGTVQAILMNILGGGAAPQITTSSRKG